jgi:hypothetical protein
MTKGLKSVTYFFIIENKEYHTIYSSEDNGTSFKIEIISVDEGGRTVFMQYPSFIQPSQESALSLIQQNIVP